MLQQFHRSTLKNSNTNHTDIRLQLFKLELELELEVSATSVSGLTSSSCGEPVAFGHPFLLPLIRQCSAVQCRRHHPGFWPAGQFLGFFSAVRVRRFWAFFSWGRTVSKLFFAVQVRRRFWHNWFSKGLIAIAIK